MGVGRGDRGAKAPLDFVILYFRIDVSVEKCFSQFRVGKIISLLVHPGKMISTTTKNPLTTTKNPLLRSPVKNHAEAHENEPKRSTQYPKHVGKNRNSSLQQ